MVLAVVGLLNFVVVFENFSQWKQKGPSTVIRGCDVKYGWLQVTGLKYGEYYLSNA
jgi:hypothetical protein